MGCHFLLQRSFQTRDHTLSPKSPALQTHSLPAKPPRKPHKMDRNKHNSNDLTIVYMDNFLKTIQNKYIKEKNRSEVINAQLSKSRKNQWSYIVCRKYPTFLLLSMTGDVETEKSLPILIDL